MSRYDPIYGAAWHRDRRLGLPPRLVPLADVDVSHIHEFVTEGFQVAAVARAAGVTPSAIHAVIERRYTNIRRSTLTKIETVTRADIYRSSREREWVPRVGFDRRYQALMAIGHTTREIHARGIYRRYHGNVIWWCTWDAMRAMYDDLWDQPGPSGLTRGRAAAKGWAPPLAWDDDSIDDPAARPHPWIELTDKGQPLKARRPGEFLEDAEFLIAAGESLAGIARRMRMDGESVIDMLKRNRRPDLVARLKLADEWEAS